MKSHGLGSFPQHISTAPTQTDRTAGPRMTTPKPVPSNIVGRPPIATPTTTNPAPQEPTPTDLSHKRGKKRELEESTIAVTPQHHRQVTPPATAVIGANGVRRPMKKQRVVRCPLSWRTIPRRDLHRSQRMSRDRLRRETFHSNNNPPPREFDTHEFTVVSYSTSYH